MYYGLHEPTCRLRSRNDTYCECGAHLSCLEDEATCTECDAPMCGECAVSRICETCKEPCCDDCITICDHCGERLCPTCKESGDLPECAKCGIMLCSCCKDKCDECGTPMCSECCGNGCEAHTATSVKETA